MKKSRILPSASSLSLLILFSAGCASTSTTPDSSSEKKGAMEIGGEVVRETGEGFGDAAMSPLEDLNLKKDKIPEYFDTFQTQYDPLPKRNCSAIAEEVRKLDTLLKTDIDVVMEIKRREKEEGIESEGTLASDASGLALGAIASEASGIIPFRGIVRHATGASAHQKKLNAAYDKAYLRRSYLKGLGQGLGCDFPAAPYPFVIDEAEESGAPIEYRGTNPD